MKHTRDCVRLMTLVVVLAAGSAGATFIQPMDAPVDRLVKNMEAAVKESPQSSRAFYNLGRVHALAFELDSAKLRQYQNGDVADERWMREKPDPSKPHTLSDRERRTHVVEGVRALSRAIELDATKPEYYLSLASLLEAANEFAGELDVAPGCSNPEALLNDKKGVADLPEVGDEKFAARMRECLGIASDWGSLGETPRRKAAVALLLAHQHDKNPAHQTLVKTLLKEDWQEEVTDLYFKAFSMAMPRDTKITEQGIRGLSVLTGYEAATSYARVIHERGVREQDKVRLATAESAIEAWNKVPPCRAITPIVLGLGGEQRLADVLAPDVRTTFDLDGFGLGSTWTWVKPTTGVLVWDPSHAGKITSGVQLFGNATWWMMFESGYSALAALDDDRDGEVSGDELTGLAVWFDRNSNGVSEPGEVVPVEEMGIAAISTGIDGRDGISPMNSRGVRMSDGRVLATWDWTTTPVVEQRAIGASWSVIPGLLGASTLADTWRRRGRCKRASLPARASSSSEGVFE